MTPVATFFLYLAVLLFLFAVMAGIADHLDRRERTRRRDRLRAHRRHMDSLEPQRWTT